MLLMRADTLDIPALAAEFAAAHPARRGAREPPMTAGLNTTQIARGVVTSRAARLR
jgi:hypothetical protein